MCALAGLEKMATPLVGSLAFYTMVAALPATVSVRTVARSSRVLVGACVLLPPSVGVGAEKSTNSMSNSFSWYHRRKLSLGTRVASSRTYMRKCCC